MSIKALFINASPKKDNSATNRLIQRCIEYMALSENDYEIRYAYDTARSAEKMDLLWQSVQVCDLLVAVYPVYVDTIPAALSVVFEEIDQRYRTADESVRPAVTAIANCGFPESVHTRVSLEVCELFAKTCNLQWLGGLGLGAGGMVLAVPFIPEGGPFNKAAAALKEAAQYLNALKPIPENIQVQFAAQHVAPWLYRLMANLGWFRGKQLNKTKTSLWAKPNKK